MRPFASTGTQTSPGPLAYGLGGLAWLSHLLSRPLGGRGHYRLWSLLGAVVSDHPVVVRLSADSLFLLDLRDWYWNRLLSRDFVYEPEVEWLLRYLRGLRYTFVDAGANHGYWSIRASSDELGRQRTFAIEADAANFL